MKTLVINGRTYRAVDEEGDDFSAVAGELRAIADNLENEDYSEESRLEAIKAVMPLVGKMRKGISVNEEESDIDDTEESDVEDTEDTDEGFVATKKRCKKSGDESENILNSLADLNESRKWGSKEKSLAKLIHEVGDSLIENRSTQRKGITLLDSLYECYNLADLQRLKNENSEVFK